MSETMSDPISELVAFDKTRAKVFQANIVGIMNGGALALMISLGHKTGLFDSMNGKQARTAAEIASTWRFSAKSKKRSPRHFAVEEACPMTATPASRRLWPSRAVSAMNAR